MYDTQQHLITLNNNWSRGERRGGERGREKARIGKGSEDLAELGEAVEKPGSRRSFDHLEVPAHAGEALVKSSGCHWEMNGDDADPVLDGPA